MNTFPTDKPIVFFDGVCNLCDKFVQLIIKQDPKKKIRFTTLQSDIGKQTLAQHNLSTKLKTVIVLHKGQVYTHSDAALETFKILGGKWALLYIFKIIPKFIRNAIYDWIAANRYKWFGKKKSCMMPTPDIKERFL